MVNCPCERKPRCGEAATRLGAPGPGPDAPVNPGRERLLTVDDERFRVRLRLRHGPLYDYDYDWLTGPNPGYGFGMSGPSEQSDDDHKAQIRHFLAEIDPGTGYLPED